MIRRIFTTLTILGLAILAGYSQTTIVDFDNIPYQVGAWNGAIEIIDNPSSEGMNTSAKVCKYTTPPDQAWTNCAVVDYVNNVKYQLLDSIQFMVLAPSASQMFVKLEDFEVDGEIQPTAYATSVESSDWQIVTLKFSGLTGEDSINATFNRFAFFFNVTDATGGEDWIFDNITVYPTEAVNEVSTDSIEAQDADLARIFKAMNKGRNGEDLTIGVIGGSITEGYAASTNNKRWANLMVDWWENKFPSSTIKLINAGWGGTGSDIGVHRVYDDLLKENPDYIVAEFAVNDSEGDHAKKMMEGLAQQVLLAENAPGLSILMLKQSNGRTAKDSHLPVAYHYKVPFVSFADLIDAKVQEDGVSLNSIFVDGLHPNDVGMAYIAEMFQEHLDSIYLLLPEETNLPEIDRQLPTPIISDIYSNTFQYFTNNLDPLTNSGWQATSNGWTTTEANNQIDFQIIGNVISLIFTKNDDADRGRAEVWVDEGPAVTIDAYMNENWGTMYAFSLVQEGLSDGEHVLHIKSIEVSSTSGNKVNIARILTAGNVEDHTNTAQIRGGNQDWINIYPNPAKNDLYVQYYISETKDISINLINMQGKCLWEKQISNAPQGLCEYKIEVDQNNLTPGVYLIQIGDHKTSRSTRVLIN